MTDTETQKLLKDIQEKFDTTAKPCPSCGRCPTCGRGGTGYYPSPWIIPHYPPYPPQPWITRTTSGTTGDVKL